MLSGSLPDTTVNSLANGQAVWIGRFNAGTRLLNGDTDLVRITPEALTPSGFLSGFDQFDTDRDAIPDDFERLVAGGSTASIGTGDVDGDGRFDMLEYATGTSPLAADSASILTARSADHFLIQSSQRDLPPWISNVLESSSGLTDWSPAVSTITLAGPDADVYQRTDDIDFSSSPPARLFFRHRVVSTR